MAHNDFNENDRELFNDDGIKFEDGKLVFRINADKATCTLINFIYTPPTKRMMKRMMKSMEYTDHSKVIIPSTETYTGKLYPVTGIGKEAFSKYPYLKTLTIPDSVTSIGKFAFRNCSNLKTLAIPDSVASIGYGAFTVCENLRRIIVQWKTPLSVPDESFRYFKQDKCELIVPQGTVDLYKSAPVWKNFGSITDTLFTIKVEFIFAITSRLKGEWTKVITERGTLLAATEKGRKWTCDATKNILLYNSMAPIYFYNGCFTFRLNSDLTTCTLVGHNNNAYPHVVDIPSTATYEGRIYTVTGIEDYPFWFRDPPEPFPLQPYHEDSRSSLIPDPDEEYWIENLFEITIPNTVKCIGHPLCTDCYELTEIHVALDNPCFSSKDGVLFNKDQSRLIAYPPGIRGRFDIPSSVTSIRDGAFYLSHVTSVTIHSLVTSIGEGAFEMSYLRRIDVDPDNPQYCDEDGVLFSKDKTKLIAYTDARKNYRIPDSVKSIGEKAFVGCYFQTLTVPWEIPISIPSSVFKYHGLATKELIVPPGSEALYESAPVWQDFGFIISSDEYLSSDIKVNLDVHRDSSTLHINTPYVEEIEVSSISGAIIYKGVKSGWTMAIEVNYSENAIIVKGNGWRRKARKRTYYT